MCQDIGHCVGVSTEGVDAGFCPHVPHASRGVPASSQEDVDGRVEGHAVDTTQVTVVVTDHLQTNTRLILPHTPVVLSKGLTVETLQSRHQ